MNLELEYRAAQATTRRCFEEARAIADLRRQAGLPLDCFSFNDFEAEARDLRRVIAGGPAATVKRRCDELADDLRRDELNAARQRLAHLQQAAHDDTGSAYRCLESEIESALNPSGEDFEREDPDTWRAAIHESAHAMAALHRGAVVVDAIARRDGTGCCNIDTSTLTATERAEVLAVGDTAAARLFYGKHRYGGYGDDERAALLPPEAQRAGESFAESFIDLHEPAILCGARLLYLRANQTTSGDDLAEVWRQRKDGWPRPEPLPW